MIEAGKTVVRKSTYYRHIKGKVLSVIDGKAHVEWNSSTGTRKGRHLKRWIKITSLNEIV